MMRDMEYKTDEERLKELDMFSLVKRRSKGDLITLFKYFQGCYRDAGESNFLILTTLIAWLFKATNSIESSKLATFTGPMGKVAALWFLCLLHNGVLWLLVLVRCEAPLQQSVAVRSGYCPWECMTFVQMWPGSFCVALASRFDCVIPKAANNWTIHGLWPSDIAECCHYWYIFPSDLNDLTTELNRYWPSFINLSNFQFWEKEWKKHGTCAGCVETLNSPNKYFRSALSLHTKYNIDRAFQRKAVIPSCQWSYQLSTFQAALQPILGDQYELQCVTDIQGRQILVQIKVSLHTDFSTGCIESGFRDGSPYKPCQAERRIFYFPPNQENPRNPCP